MKTIGFVASKKENEYRRAIILDDIKDIKNKEFLYFEEGYGKNLGFSDEDIIKSGCNILSKEKIYDCDIICDPKIGDSEYLDRLKNKTVFGWIHATQNYNITQKFVDNKLTGYAWEKMFEGNRHVFENNNQIAGEAAILHAMTLYGNTFENLRIAVLGKGNTSKGAQNIIKKFTSNIKVYDSKMETEFKNEISNYDVIVNCILWDVNRKDHIIYKNDLKKLKKDCLIIDISCDRNGGIETSFPTTIDNPVYQIDGITHYVVDHTPSLLYKKASISISNEVKKYLDFLIEEKENIILNDALIIKDGIIIDNEINVFQKRID